MQFDGIDCASYFSPIKAVIGKGRWTRFKVIFVTNIVLSSYSLLALVFSLLTDFHALKNARILLVANTPELALSMLAAAFALVISYIAYKRRTLNLEAKVNQQWSQELGAAGRLTIQSALGYCGYYSPFVEATVSATCYSRSILPGCKQQFLEFQEKALTRWYIVSFGLVPVHIGACSIFNNGRWPPLLQPRTYRFGKGMMPKAYRLSREAMAVIMEQYASAQMPPNPFSPNPTPAASASDLNLAGPRPHEDGDEEGDGYSYGYDGVKEGDERGAGGQYAKYESLDIGAGAAGGRF
ncbi:hypothetical protein B0H16DRAFT_1790303 [Mycena metata]|uniref:Uncharacterized protein n=1 Tax=Mycena metata TaxID=1033252 RepID=A0AAD7HJ77_9AGAR|nr:hypothetical protein B0H16DRAFT_1790303 [Mycena metata]